MTFISKEILANAIVAVRAMDMRQCKELADEINAKQPQLLYSVLALRNFGVTATQLELPINILLVSYQCIKACDHKWPVISEVTQERCIKRIVGRMRFNEGLSPVQSTEAVSTFIAEHKEPWLLAYVFGELGVNNLLDISTEAQKNIVLGTLNLVECIADTD